MLQCSRVIVLEAQLSFTVQQLKGTAVLKGHGYMFVCIGGRWGDFVYRYDLFVGTGEVNTYNDGKEEGWN